MLLLSFLFFSVACASAATPAVPFYDHWEDSALCESCKKAVIFLQSESSHTNLHTRINHLCEDTVGDSNAGIKCQHVKDAILASTSTRSQSVLGRFTGMPELLCGHYQF